MAKKFSLARCLLALTLALGLGQQALAKNTLITMPGPKANLASAFKAVGKDQYEFTIDKSKGIKTSIVRQSLKKDSSFGKVITDVKTTDATVTVTYKGDTNAFLTTVAGIEIKKGGGNAGISVASTVSDGGIRAKAAIRSPGQNEVMAHVANANVKVNDKLLIEVKVKQIGPGVNGLKVEEKIKVEAKGVTIKKEDKGKTVFVVLGANKGSYWEASKVDFK